MNNVSDIHTLPRQPLWEHPLHCSMHVFRSLVGQAAHRRHLVDRYLTTRSLHKPSLPTDAILLKGLQFFGYHGVLKEARFKRLLFEADFNQRSWPVSKHWNTSLSDEQEQTLGQKFCVDARLTCCLKAAGRSDDIEDTVSYAEIFRCLAFFIFYCARPVLHWLSSLTDFDVTQ